MSALYRTVWRLAIAEATASARRSRWRTRGDNSVGLILLVMSVAFALGIFAGVLTR